MAFYDKFPYTNFQELNLDRLIQELIKVKEGLDFVIENASLKYADPIQWNITKQYAANTVVIDPATGIAYISTKPVPDNILITNTGYWTPIFDLSSFFDDTETQITALQTAIDTINGNITNLGTDIDNLDNKIDTEVENINARIEGLSPKTVKDFGAVGDGTANDTAAFQAAISSGEKFIVPTGFYRLTENIFTTSEHCTDDQGTYPQKKFIVTSFNLNMVPLMSKPYSYEDSSFTYWHQFTGITVDTRRRRIITGQGNDGGLLAWSLDTGALLFSSTVPEVGHCNDMCYDPVDDLIYVASYSDTNQTSAAVINPEALTLNSMKILGYPVHTIAYDPDNELFYASDYTTCHVYERGWTQIKTFSVNIYSQIMNTLSLPTSGIIADGQGSFIKDSTFYYLIWVHNTDQSVIEGNYYNYATLLACFNGEDLTMKDVYSIYDANTHDEIEGFECVGDSIYGIVSNSSRHGQITFWTSAKENKFTVAPAEKIRYFTRDQMFLDIDETTNQFTNDCYAYRIGNIAFIHLRTWCYQQAANWVTAAHLITELWPIGTVPGGFRASAYSETPATPANYVPVEVFNISGDGGAVLVRYGQPANNYNATIIYPVV